MPIIMKNKDGRLQMFVIASDEALYSCTQIDQDGPFGEWFRHGGNFRLIRAAANKNGALQVFGIGSLDNEVFSTAQVRPSSSWSDFFHHPTAQMSEIAVGTNLNGSLQVFGITNPGGGNVVFSNTQNSPNGSWSDIWHRHADGEVQKICVGRNENGALQVFGIGVVDNNLFSIAQIRANGRWTPAWHHHADGALKEIAVARNSDGRLQVFGAGVDGVNLFSLVQLRRNGSWSESWFNHGSPGHAVDTVSVSVLPNDKLLLTVSSQDAQTSHSIQNFPSGSWGPWIRGAFGVEGGLLLKAKDSTPEHEGYLYDLTSLFPKGSLFASDLLRISNLPPVHDYETCSSFGPRDRATELERKRNRLVAWKELRNLALGAAIGLAAARQVGPTIGALGFAGAAQKNIETLEDDIAALEEELEVTPQPHSMEHEIRIDETKTIKGVDTSPESRDQFGGIV